ncbi:MAG: hypothetical protein ACRD0J_12805, partial [Acidimicrobiales bacterium]
MSSRPGSGAGRSPAIRRLDHTPGRRSARLLGGTFDNRNLWAFAALLPRLRPPSLARLPRLPRL